MAKPLVIKGDFGNALLSGTVTSGGSLSRRYLELDLDASLNFFRSISILRPRLAENAMGIYSMLNANGENKVKFASLSTPKHLLKKRSNGCVWNPKGKVRMNTSEIDLCPLEYQGEHCPDHFWNTCLEKLMGIGNQVRDINASPEARALFAEVVSKIYDGLGNSYYDVVWWGKHRIFADADAGDYYTVDDQEWEDLLEQQDACGGYFAMIDYFADEEGRSNFTVPIGDFNDHEYTGQLMGKNGLFERMLRSQLPVMKLANNQNAAGPIGKGVFLVTRSIFDAYEEEILTRYGNIPETMYYRFNRQFCAKLGCTEGIADGVLKYKGHYVVVCDAWDLMASLLGIVHHRALLLTPGVLGLTYDVSPQQQFNGMGLRMVQKLDPGEMGKVYMDTTFKVGTGIIDPDYMVNAHFIGTPDLKE